METKRFLAERLEGGHIRETSPFFGSLVEAIQWAVASGDGEYMAGPESPWGGVKTEGSEGFSVRDGAIALPERSDWERAIHGSDLVRKVGRPIPETTTLWVLKLGALSSEGCFREPGTCLARTVRCGDRVLDRLAAKCEDGRRLEVFSERQGEHHYDWTEEGPRYNPERCSIAAVSLSGRAAGWGTLGDDSYDPASADDMLDRTLIEAVLGTAKWEYAQIYYDVREVSDDSVGRRDPVKVVDLSLYPLSDQGFYSEGLDARSLAEDRRPMEILEGNS